MVFILDASGSVGATNFDKMLKFVKKIASNFDIGETGTQVAVITFSTGPINRFSLNKYTNKVSLETAINNIPYTGGWTYTGKALKYAREVSFHPRNGARPNAVKIAIVITDGKSNRPDDTSAEAKLLRQHGVVIFAIGVGDGPDQLELNAIATDPDHSHVFFVTDFDALNFIKETIKHKACEGTNLIYIYKFKF